MSIDPIHAAAQSQTPAEIDVPKSWAGLLVWAVGKWGAGAVFLILLFPVYSDLKESNARFVEMSRANVEALKTMAVEISKNRDHIGALTEEIRRNSKP